MAEVRFILKGEKQETTFTPGRDQGGNILLYANTIEGKVVTIPLNSEEGILKLAGDNPFEEDIKIVNERLLGLSQEWMDKENSGVENDSDEDYLPTTKPGYSPDDIFVDTRSFPIPELIRFIDEGDIEISPNFQRHFVWDNTRQSRLIESIFLGLPLPSIYLSQYKDGHLAIVDGLQRLSTIKRFNDNKLRLSNLEYLTECNGHTYKELEGEKILSPLRLRKFKFTQIMGFVIDYRSPSALKFDLFRRLNTGGKPLNRQEIRNCLSRNRLQTTLQKMTSCEEFLLATDYSVDNTRMTDQELALRFIYFFDQYTDSNPIGSYSGRMDDELDNYIDHLNGKEDLDSYIEHFKNGMESAYRLFGEYAFRKIMPDYREKRRTAINKLLFTTIAVLLARHHTEYADKIAKIEQDDWSVADHLAQLIAEDSRKVLFSVLTWNTNAKENFKEVYSAMKSLFDQHLL